MQLTEAQAETFSYPQLDTLTPSIRLIRLERTSTGSIVGSLKTFSPRNVKNGYRAISYVWGPKNYSNTITITINNHPFPILDNLYQILEVICDDEILNQCWWWIDYICINQGKGLQVEMERNSQVAMMKEIYENAQTVLGWLGPGSREVKEAIEFLYVLRRNRNRLHAQQDSRDKVLGPELEDREKWKAVEKLFLREWWERVWTLQEYIVPTDFRFYCGKDNISRDDMKIAVYAIRLSLSIDKSLMSWMAYGRAWNRRRLYMWYRDRLPISLLGLIAYVGNYKYSNPRDRIYSVLGMVDDSHVVGQPKYGDDVVKVYTDLVERFVKKHNSLDVICLADRFNWDMVEEGTSMKLPTWCPDWRAEDLSWVIPAMVCQSSGNIENFRPTQSVSTRGEKVATYAAGTCEYPLAFEFSDDKMISCEGILISHVDGIGGLKVVRYKDDGGIDREEEYECVQSGSEQKPLQPDELDPTTASKIMTDLMRCLMLDRKDRYLDQCLSDGYCHLHLRDLCLAALRTPQEVHPSFLDWFGRNRNLHIRGHSLEDVCKESGDVNLGDHGGIPDRETFLSRFTDTTQYMSRRFMTTSDGNTGMVPCRTQKGDQIWVLLGCSVPVVLRKRQEDAAFEMVGECYLNNFMDGQALEHLDGDETSRFEDIRLA
jgi:hypothetical protein